MSHEHPLDELARLREDLAAAELDRDRLRGLLLEWLDALWDDTLKTEAWEPDFYNRVTVALARRDTHPDEEETA